MDKITVFLKQKNKLKGKKKSEWKLKTRSSQVKVTCFDEDFSQWTASLIYLTHKHKKEMLVIYQASCRFGLSFLCTTVSSRVLDLDHISKIFFQTCEETSHWRKLPSCTKQRKNAKIDGNKDKMNCSKFYNSQWQIYEENSRFLSHNSEA